MLLEGVQHNLGYAAARLVVQITNPETLKSPRSIS